MSKSGQRSRTSNPGPKIAMSQSRTGGSKTGVKQPSATNTAGGTNKAPSDPKKAKKKEEGKKTIGFQLPPLSVVGKKREINFEEIRKKVIRRGNPEGEDKKELAGILKHLKDSKSKIRVHEFVQLVAKFTADNGEAMRKVLEDDLAQFRKTVTKVYENMTQDVSDVLVNEQIQTTNFYQEKFDMFNEKLLWMISEIFQMIPEFDFERYAKDKDDFLKMVAPLPVLIVRDAAEADNQRRQEAFHRLQWLKIEGGRLSEENKRLEDKLNKLKEDLAREQAKATIKQQIMSDKKEDLEKQEHAKQEHLHELEGLLTKTAVRAEAYIRLEQDEKIRLTKAKTTTTTKKQTKKKQKRPEWVSTTAADLEAAAARELVEAESAKIDEKKRLKNKEKELTFGQSGTTMTRMSESQASGGAEYPGLQSASRMQERTIQQTTTTIQERRQLPRGRYQAPKDTWRGFT